MHIHSSKYGDDNSRFCRTVTAIMIMTLLIHSSAGAVPPDVAEPLDWRIVDVTEAFRGSLRDVHTPGAVVGGASGVGTANKGNFSVNADGHMAITFVRGHSATAEIVVARSRDGENWERHIISDARLRNVLFQMGGNNRTVTIDFRNTGPGPQVQIDEEGNICLTYLKGSHVYTMYWPADVEQLRQRHRLAADIPIEWCSAIRFDRQVAWFQLHHDRGNFYLVTQPQSNFTDHVRVYRFSRDRWVQLGEELPAHRGQLAWDDTTGEIYLGALVSRPHVEGRFPTVFRWDVASESWQELAADAQGLREQLGITSYSNTGCPTVVAHDGTVWAFWWFKGVRRMLQGAVYDDGQWKSCAQSYLSWKADYYGLPRITESMGQNAALVLTESSILHQTVRLEAFRDSITGDLVVFYGDGFHGLVIRDGQAWPIYYRPQFDRAEHLDPVHANLNALLPQAGRGFQGFFTNPASPHLSRTQKHGRHVYLHATLGSQPNGQDVFVFKFTPAHVPDLGFRVKSRLEDGKWRHYVDHITANSIADQVGIEDGDRLVGVSGFHFSDSSGPDDVLATITRARAASESRELNAVVRRNGVDLTYPLAMVGQVPGPHSVNDAMYRGYLGVYIEDLESRLATTLNFEGDGVIVADLIPSSPAAQAGIRADDIITHFDETQMTSADELRRTVAMRRPGAEIKLRVFRDGETLTVSVTLAGLPDSHTAAHSGHSPRESPEAEQGGN